MADGRAKTWLVAVAVAMLLGDAPVPDLVVGDAIPDSLTGHRGDPARGRAIVGNRQLGQCLLCHSGPFPDPHLQGNLAPSLEGVGSRLSEGQIRLRLVDSRLVDPDSFMPPGLATDGLVRVGASWRGRTLLSAEQVEDVVAFLATLRAP